MEMLFTVEEMVVGLVKDYKISISEKSVKDSSVISQITECINLGTVKPRIDKNGSVKLIDGVYKFISDDEVANKLVSKALSKRTGKKSPSVVDVLKGDMIEKGNTITLVPVGYKLNDKNEVVRIKNNHQVISPNKKVITLADYDKADLYIEGFLRHKLSNWKAESMNLSFFDKPKFVKCTQKQLAYLTRLIEEKFIYLLSDSQSRYLSKLSMKQVSELISSIQEMDVVIKEHKYNVGKCVSAYEVEGFYLNK